MAKLLINKDPSKIDQYGTMVHLSRMLQGDVIEGLKVVANSPVGMSVVVQPGTAGITTGTYPTSYKYWIVLDTSPGETVTIDTANSNPRIDFIIAYVDLSVTTSTSNTNNSNNVWKLIAVKGTPATSNPPDPTTTQIQASAVGASNPYIILGKVQVNGSATQITNSDITDVRVLTSPSSTLAYAESSSTNQNSSGSTTTAVTGCSVTVNIPTAGRWLKITGFGQAYNTTGTANQLHIYDGSTSIKMSPMPLSTFTAVAHTVVYRFFATAGLKTYSLRFNRQAGQGSGDIVLDNAAARSFILVEAG